MAKALCSVQSNARFFAPVVTGAGLSGLKFTSCHAIERSRTAQDLIDFQANSALVLASQQHRCDQRLDCRGPELRAITAGRLPS
jgi:hypothetical protein